MNKMTKFKLKGLWESIRHDDEKILTTFIDEIEDKTVPRYDDDIIELEFEITKIKRREAKESDGDSDEPTLTITKVLK